MRRFYCPHLVAELGDRPAGPAAPALPDPLGGLITLDAVESRHAVTVLRVGPGDAVQLFDGHGAQATATVTAARRDGLRVQVSALEHHPPATPHVDVAAALPKGPRLVAMVQALSQAGADGLIPLQSDRGVVAASRVNRGRLERVAVEAAKQCGRGHLLQIAAPATLQEVASEARDVRLIAAPAALGEGPTVQSLRAARRVLILVGPEGGWTDHEMHTARRAGAVPWQFGPHVMRIETACCAAAAIVRYLARDAASLP